LALHGGSLFAGPTQMPGKPLSALAAPELTTSKVSDLAMVISFLLASDRARDGSAPTPLPGMTNATRVASSGVGDPDAKQAQMMRGRFPMVRLT